MMPALEDTIEDSEWEFIEGDAAKLGTRIADWADSVRSRIKGMSVELPSGCIRRSKEKWRSLKRVATAAGGDWVEIADRLIAKSIAEEAACREAGLKTQPPGMVLLIDLHTIWSDDERFIPTLDLVPRLIEHNVDFWGPDSPYGKALTEHRFGRMLSQAAKVTSQRPGGKGSRGFLRSQLEPAWRRLGIAPIQSGDTGEADESGGDAQDDNHFDRSNSLHRFQSDPLRIVTKWRSVRTASTAAQSWRTFRRCVFVGAAHPVSTSGKGKADDPRRDHRPLRRIVRLRQGARPP